MVNLQQFLMSEYSRRRLNNSAYSMRAFARDIGISKSSISAVLNGKASLSDRICKIIAKNLGCDFQELREARSIKFEYAEVGQGVFSQIYDWYYYAVLSLARMKTEKADKESLSKRLGISKIEAQSAVNKLQELNLIVIEGGCLMRTSHPIATSADIPMRAIKEHHSQNLDRAKKSLFEIPVELREISSVTTPINMDKLAEAKDEIRKFQIKMSKLLNEGESHEVYTMAVQLFPQTNLEHKQEV